MGEFPIKRYAFSYKKGAGSVISFSEVDYNKVKSIGGVSQNTDEDGVFISDHALQKSRSLLSVESKELVLHPNGIRSFIYVSSSLEQLNHYSAPVIEKAAPKVQVVANTKKLPQNIPDESTISIAKASAESVLNVCYNFYFFTYFCSHCQARDCMAHLVTLFCLQEKNFYLCLPLVFWLS